MELETIRLSKISQVPRDTYYMDFPPVWNQDFIKMQHESVWVSTSREGTSRRTERGMKITKKIPYLYENVIRKPIICMLIKEKKEARILALTLGSTRFLTYSNLPLRHHRLAFCIPDVCR